MLGIRPTVGHQFLVLAMRVRFLHPQPLNYQNRATKCDNDLTTVDYRWERMTFIDKKETGYPSKDKIHFRGTKFPERHPFIPPINISTAIDFVSRGHLD